VTHKTHQLILLPLSVLCIAELCFISLSLNLGGLWYLFIFSSLSAYHWHLIIYRCITSSKYLAAVKKKVSFKRE
jgi:hypothetical protein